MKDKSASKLHDAGIAWIERLPFGEITFGVLAALIIGGFFWRLPTVTGLLDREDGEIPFYATLAVVVVLCLMCFALLWTRTPLTEYQLRQLLKRRARQAPRPGAGLPTLENYRKEVELASTLAEGHQEAPVD